MTWNAFKLAMVNFFSTGGVALFQAIILFVIGYLLIKLLLKITARILGKAKVEKSARKFLYTSVKYVAYFILIMIIASSLGISITGLIAVFSAFGLALSLALQGSLSNLANGIVIIITKPFKENDIVTINNFEGVVKEIRLTHTIITSFANKQVSIPNKMVVENVILNSSVLETKKASYDFTVSYASDVEKVKEIAYRCLSRTNYVLTDPKPLVTLEALEANGIRFKVSYFVESKHYATVYSAMLEDIFNELKKEKITLSFAQLDVRVKQEKETLPFYNGTKLTQKPEEKPAPKIVVKEEQEVVADEEPEDEVKDYKDYLIEHEIELNDEETDKETKVSDNKLNLEENDEQEEEEKEERLTSKIFKKLQPKQKDKKPTIIIKKSK